MTNKKNILNRASILVVLLMINFICAFSAMAQATKIKGRVVDASTGEGIAFASVYFNNTTIGVTTDLDGYYTMETRDKSIKTLAAVILGYEEVECPITKGHFQKIDFKLKPMTNAIDAVVIKPDDSYVRWILKQVDEHKKYNNPEKRESYDCEVYSKMELDLTNAEEQIRNKTFRKNFGFVFNYMDTSVVSGQAYLPVMISESNSHYYHSLNPSANREVIHASRISGIEKDFTLAQFTGNMHVKVNFYDNFINIFDVELPSPLHSSGHIYYNYYLVDSLKIDGRKTYRIRFHPSKFVSSPTFDGEMEIDVQDWALRTMHARLKKGSNVNWVRDMVADVKHRPMGDGTWFYEQDKLYVDFSVFMRDSSKAISFLGHRQLDYSMPKFDVDVASKMAESEANVIMDKDVLNNDEEYWEKVRPYTLSEKEKNIYKMVDSVKAVPLYRNIYTVVNTIVAGYYERKYIGFGPYFKTFSFNNLEGARFQLGARTTHDFSKKIRLMLYGAYGTKDHSFKGGGEIEYMFDNFPTSKLTLSFKRDVLQLGKGYSSFTESNILSSILSKGGSQKLSPVNEYSIRYDKEWNLGFNNIFELSGRRIFANEFVPMYTPDSSYVNSVATNQLHYQARFSKDEIVGRGSFNKSYLRTRYPVLTLDFYGSLEGLGKNEYSFFRPEAHLSYKLQLPPVGTSDLRFSAGTILGKVPYPFLKLHEGNGTYFFDKSAFACMDFYEFASDTWATFSWEHNFKGFFLGKIPLLKKLQWREVFTLKAAYGTISKKNNGMVTNLVSDSNSTDPDKLIPVGKNGREITAPLLFPEGMSDLNKPYVEMGVGVSNIFRLIRFDAFWRVTHRHEIVNGKKQKVDHLFALNFGLELRF